jgi:hypothetical protein
VTIPSGGYGWLALHLSCRRLGGPENNYARGGKWKILSGFTELSRLRIVGLNKD